MTINSSALVRSTNASVFALTVAGEPQRSGEQFAILVAVGGEDVEAEHVVLSAIPLLTGVGIVSVDPTFFGGYLLLASSLLGAVGAAQSDNFAGRKRSDNAESD